MVLVKVSTPSQAETAALIVTHCSYQSPGQPETAALIITHCYYKYGEMYSFQYGSTCRFDRS